ncbi:hypothetical protein B0H15DRAFT_957028 [Mycena belliarum]|uniref:Uncharacterized protein n=1 Tax=Mycena belliarum TaxID=1033014 RepID=A0AAD6TN43_9AGAR|nr:hypothetical protein B0H15DRAFT_957028 [Mycena belliae]
MSHPVPLTTHHLRDKDRARLIRSTQKIKEVVGETPYLVDVGSSTPSSSQSQSANTKRARGKQPSISSALPVPNDARPVLYVRVPEPTEHIAATPAPSPTLTVSLGLRAAVVSDDTARRRKMAKLARTLGPNVPKELVFPPPTKNQLSRLRRLTARSLDPPLSPSRPESVTSARTSRRRSTVPRGDPISHGWVWVGKREEIPEEVLARARTDSGLPEDWVSVEKPVEKPVDPQVRKLRAMYRKEEGWSGEWAGAVQNMDEVVTQLRSLKTK